MGVDVRPLGALAGASLDQRERDRLALAERLLTQTSLPPEDLTLFETLAKGDAALVSGDYALSSLTEYAPALSQQVQSALQANPASPNALMAAMLLAPAHLYPTLPGLRDVPNWLMQPYTSWRLAYALIFTQHGEADRYSAYVDHTIGEFHHAILQAVPDQYTMILAAVFISKFNPLAFCNNDDFHDQARWQKAQIEEFYLLRTGLKLLQVFPEKPKTGKLNVGVMADTTSANNDTYYILSFVEKIPRDHIQLTLFYSADAAGAFTDYFMSLFDRKIKIDPQITADTLTAIRGDNLDVLLCGSFKGCFFGFLPNHFRLAKLQLMTPAVPNTTGYANWDVFLTGINEAPGDLTPRYTEEALKMGSMINYNAFAHDPQTRTIPTVSRAQLGVPETAILFTSNASLYKLSPEQIASWARILAAVPDSHLLLMPFGITWQTKPPAIFRMLTAEFERNNIDFSRVHLQMSSFDARLDIQSVLESCDVYLDSYPFSGGASMTDPLEVNLPIAARNGQTLKGRLGGPMLSFIGLDELVTDSAADYETLAIRLGSDAAYRAEIRTKMKAALEGGLPYYETETPSRQISEAVLTLCEKRTAMQKALRAMPVSDLQQAITNLSDRFRASNSQLFASLTESELVRLILLPHFQSQPSFTTPHLVHVGAKDGMFAVPFLMDGWNADLIENAPDYQQYLTAIAAATSRARITNAGLADLRLDRFAAQQSLGQIDILVIDAGHAPLSVLATQDFIRLQPGIIAVRVAPETPPFDAAPLAALETHGYQAMTLSYGKNGGLTRIGFAQPSALGAISTECTILFLPLSNTDLLAGLVTLLESFLPGRERKLTRLCL